MNKKVNNCMDMDGMGDFSRVGNNNHPYYDRPSKQTSFQIAVISIICLVLLILGLMVSEVVSDFDNTSINKNEDNKREISYHMEIRGEGVWEYLTSINNS